MDRTDDLERVSAAARRLIVANEQYSMSIGATTSTHRTHLAALAAIMDAPEGTEMTPGRLGAAMGLSSAATTALIDRLEAAGHARRRRSERDRRVVEIEMTDAALELGRTLYSPLGDAMRDGLAGFGPEELDAAARVMDALESATARASAVLRQRPAL